MRAVLIDRFGGPEVMYFGEIAIPDPGPGMVQVRMACASVNPADWKSRAGWIVGQPNYAPVFPLVVGFDGAGTVHKVGEGVTRVRVGQRVALWTSQRAGRWGSYAEYVNTIEDATAVIPDNVSFEQAATVPIAAQTAWQDVFYPDRGALAAGHKVFIHGGSGGVGSYAIQFARDAGVHVATSCSKGNHAYVRELGAELTLDYRTEDLVKRVQEWAPEGVHAVIDAVGINSLPRSLEMIRPGGTLVRIATLDASDHEGQTAEVAAKVGKRSLIARRAHADSAKELDHIFALIGAGKVKPPPIEVLPIEEVAIAHRRVEEGHVRGKLVLRIEKALA